LKRPSEWPLCTHHQAIDLEEYYTPEELAEMRPPEFMDGVEAIVKRGASAP
jgi:hypothetical protein